MGGLGPGIGGGEWFVIGLVALLVVGPERLPVLLRQLGKMVAKARGMANEFRASFDEMARQSELDELRKEVEALRTGQGALGAPVRLGAEADAAFKDIQSDLSKPLFAAETPAAAPAAIAEPTVASGPSPVEAPPVIAEPAPKPRKRDAAAPKAEPAPTASKPTTRKPAAAKAAATTTPKAPRKASIRNTKLDL